MNLDAMQDLRRIIREELRGLRMPELAVVQDIHPHADEGDDDNYACTVRLRDSEAVLTRVPVLTQRKGMASIPDVGDLVLVQYLAGAANAPVIVGTFYNDEDRPPPSAEGEARFRLPFDGGEGEGVDVHVTSAEAAATLTLGASLKIELKDDDPVVLIDVGDGQASVQIDSDGTVAITSTKALNFEAPEIAMKADSAMTLEAGGEVTVKGAVINLN